MKNLLLTTVLMLSAGIASAQMAEVDSEIAANLVLAITSSGHDCAQVTNVEPVGNTGAKISCILVAGSDASATYDISITADGIEITKE